MELDVTVVIPCYNYGRYVADAVASVLHQPDVPKSVVIVNDGSTDDNTWKVLIDIANTMNRVTVISYLNSKGTASALNLGIDYAKTEYIAILSADDMFADSRLTTLLSFMSTLYPKHFVYDDLWIFGGAADTYKLARMERDGDEDKLVARLPVWDRLLVIEKQCIHAGLVYPKQAWTDVGGYPEEFGDGREDWAYAVALGEAGWIGRKYPRALYKYRRHGANRSASNVDPQSKLKFRLKIAKRFSNV